ncbi:MAG: mechanosensitive ion channel domain-containing protein [Verrucomicrobiota bacterium]|nr:mechanosensitive ion channel domain-containing protein [Verrucomicrobiota bacterium]
MDDQALHTDEAEASFDLQAFTDNYLVPWGTNIGFALLILISGIILSKWFVKLVCRGMRRAKIDDMLVDFVTSLLKWALYFVFIIAALNRLGVPTTSFIAVLGAAGLAIGLALKDSLQNFAAGVMLIIFRPFKTGDFIQAGGAEGVVENVHIFSTTMRTPDNREIILPNGDIFGGKIVNNNARGTRRIDLVIGVGYDDDLRKAKQVLEGVLAVEERLLKDPEPLIAVGELGASSVDILVRPWVKTTDYFATKCALTENIKLALDDAGISIPFPQMDLHLNQDAPGLSDALKMG